MSKIVPTNDNIVVEPIAEQISSSGIIIPESVSKERPMKGKVLAVGPGKLMDDGSRQAMDINEGDTVLFSKYGPTEIKVDHKDLLLLSANDVFAKLED